MHSCPVSTQSECCRKDSFHSLSLSPGHLAFCSPPLALSSLLHQTQATCLCFSGPFVAYPQHTYLSFTGEISVPDSALPVMPALSPFPDKPLHAFSHTAVPRALEQLPKHPQSYLVILQIFLCCGTYKPLGIS